jgi:hypothetical protein
VFANALTNAGVGLVVFLLMSAVVLRQQRRRRGRSLRRR